MTIILSLRNHDMVNPYKDRERELWSVSFLIKEKEPWEAETQRTSL